MNTVVHILVGGKLTGEGEEGCSVMNSVPLRYAHFYVESLVREYRRLKRPGESFALFHDRILTRYSRAALGFVMRVQAYLRQKNINITFGLDPNSKTEKNEEFELFDMGMYLYYQLTGHMPYKSVKHFVPLLKEVVLPLTKIDPTIEKNLAAAVYKMVHHKENERAKVFTELHDLISLYYTNPR